MYTRADGSLIGLYTPNMVPGTPIGRRDGLAGNHAAGDANLNYDTYDVFAMPLKLLTDLEYKNGRFGGLRRVKAWSDLALENNEVRIGSQVGEDETALTAGKGGFIEDQGPVVFDGDAPREIDPRGHAGCNPFARWRQGRVAIVAATGGALGEDHQLPVRLRPARSLGRRGGKEGSGTREDRARDGAHA